MRWPQAGLAVLVAAGVGLGCGDSDGGAQADTADTRAGDAVDARDVDATLPPSPLYVGKAMTADALIGGPLMMGQPGGAWVIGNAEARFMIQDAGVSAGLNLYGGNLIGADLVRGDGEPGQNFFREMFPMVDWRVPTPTRVTVVDDGAAGERAVLRFDGGLGPSRIISLLDQFAGSGDLEVAIEYEVRPGVPELIMRTLITNREPREIDVPVGDFLAVGEQVQLWTPAQGFDPGGGPQPIATIGSRGESVSYGYLADDPFTVPFAESSGTAALLGNPDIAAGATLAIERRLRVGDGTLASVLAPLRDADPDTATVSGVVSDGAGGVDGAWVTALAVDGDGAPTLAIDQTRTDASGAYTLRLPQGAVALVASGHERRPSAPLALTLGASELKPNVALSIGEVATVSVAITTDGARPTEGVSAPARVSLLPLEGDTRDGRLGDTGRHRGYRVVFAGGGVDSFTTAPGRYKIVVSRGPEYARIVLDDVMLADGSVIDGHLARVIAPSGWIGCDFHQHTIGSLDSAASIDSKIRENLSAGLGCAAITDHDNITDPGPTIAALGARPAFLGLVGDEVSVNTVGHFNAYPLPLDAANPLALVGAKLWADQTVAEIFATLRTPPGERVIHVAHPRSSGLKGYFFNLKLNPHDLTTKDDDLANDFDAIEVNSEIGQASQFTPAGWAALADANAGDVPTLADWFGLLNDGRTTTALGSSDCHDPADDCGYPRTYLDVGTTPDMATDALVVAAIKGQRAVVSRGLWLSVEADGQARMGHAQLVSADPSVALRVQVAAPPWLTVTQVELYANGVFVETRTVDMAPAQGHVWIDETFTVTPTLDTYYVFVARGGGDAVPVFGGSPYALSNPVYVDTGDGQFTPPGPVALPPTQ